MRRTVFFPEPDVNGRCLGDAKQLRKMGLDEVDRPDAADVIAVRRPEHLTEELLDLDRLNVVWTPEPFHCLEWAPLITMAGRKVHIFNVFNGNVLTDNYYFVQDVNTWSHLGSDAPDINLRPIETEADLNVPFRNKMIVSMMTRRKYSMKHAGVEYSLCEPRARIAIAGYKSRRMDVYGRGWPGQISLGSSGKDKDWRLIKVDRFRDYNFAFCPENCVADFYLTEKIWDAIRANCLPIYGGSDAAYDIFPKDSFVHMQEFDTPNALFDFIDDLPFAEFRRRMNVLKAVYRNALDTNARQRSRARTSRVITSFLRAHLKLRPPVRDEDMAGRDALPASL